MRISYIITLIVILGLKGLKAQDITPAHIISGTVFEKDTGKPLEGASISSLKNKSSNISLANGSFSLRLVIFPDSLLITNTGFKPCHFSIQNPQDNIKIMMSANPTELEEVLVNTGYQQIKPNEVTGSVQVISSKTLQEQTGINILQRLNNVALGVRFDNQPINNPDLQKLNISIRGASTINGPVDPLIVLDGFIYEGNIDNIDPASIDNITILKDAAATSIWGARAGNGVIVLSTKKGSYSKRPRISFNKSTTVKQIPDLNQIYQMPAKDFIAIEELLFQNGYYDRQLRRTPQNAVSPATEIFLQRRNGLISAEDSATAIHQLSTLDGREAYRKYFYSHPITDQYSVNINGGGSINTFSFGAGYTTDKNENDAHFKKVNFQIGNSFRPLENLVIDLNLYYTNSRNSSGKPTYNSLTVGKKHVPYLKFTDDQENPLPLDKTYRKVYTDNFMPGQLLDWDYYPLEDYKHSVAETKMEELFSNISIQYKILPFLDANLSYQYQQQQAENGSVSDEQSSYARTMVNQFTMPDPITGTLLYNIPIGGINESNTTKISSYTFRGQINLHRQWRSHSLTGIVGAEVRQNRQTGNSFTAYGYSEDPLGSQAVDYITAYPTLIDGGYSSISGAPSFSKTINRFISAYTNWAYLYKRRYGLSFSIRRDGANIFGAATNDKWKPFWSAGTSWDISKESFYKWHPLPSLRLRTTYGYSGNVDLRKTPLPVAEYITGVYTNYAAIRVGQLNDPLLSWEQIATMNIGLDFSFRDKVVEGSLDYYLKKGKNMYGLSAYDYTTWGGQGFLTTNTASMKGTGLELMLNTRNIRANFSWQTTLLFNFNKNKTLKYYSPYSMGVSSFLGDGNIITPVPGKPLNAIAAFKWAGLDDVGDPEGYLGGKPSKDYYAMLLESEAKGVDGNIVYKGSSRPELFGSLINTFSFKGLTLIVNISYKGNYYFRKKSTSYRELFSSGIAYPDVEMRWKKQGDEFSTAMPSLQYPADNFRDNFYQNAEIQVLKADHIRLEYINLSYQLPDPGKSKGLKMEVYCNISNIGILWRANHEGIDPEFPFRQAPLKSLSLGIRANF